MANAVVGNKIYIEATGSATDQRTKVTYIVFTPSAADDSITLKETSSGNAVLKLQAAAAKDTKIYDFSRKPMLFNNGIYVSQISSGAVATLVTSNEGGN